MSRNPYAKLVRGRGHAVHRNKKKEALMSYGRDDMGWHEPTHDELVRQICDEITDELADFLNEELNGAKFAEKISDQLTQLYHQRHGQEAKLATTVQGLIDLIGEQIENRAEDKADGMD